MATDGKFLLDTNTIISFMRRDLKIVNFLLDLEEIFIPVTVVGELYYGAFKSSRREENLYNIHSLLEQIPVLENGVETARVYGEIKSELKEIGKPIPENDIWIASICKQYNLSLITSDKHFNLIKNLKVIFP